MQNCSVHWMMQNIRLIDIKKLMFCLTQCKLKNLNFNSYIYILYCELNMPYNLTVIHPVPLVTLLKWFILFVTGVLEQPDSESLVHNSITICSLRHVMVIQ